MDKVNEWLEFDGRKAPVHYLCGYVPGSVDEDKLSSKLLSFKAGNHTAKTFWFNHFLSKCDNLFMKDKSDLITRALSNNEQKVDLYMDYQQPLGYICNRTARLLKSRYAAGMLHKVKATSALKGLSKYERWEEVKDSYKVSEGFIRRKFKQFWFVDDIITTGATARAAWKALLECYPDIDFRVIALARTVHDPTYNTESTLIHDWEFLKSHDLVLHETEQTYASFYDTETLPISSFNKEGTFFVD